MLRILTGVFAVEAIGGTPGLLEGKEGAMLLAGIVFALLGVPLLRLGNTPAAAAAEPRYVQPSRAPQKSAIWWIERVLAEAPEDLRVLLRALAVEPLPVITGTRRA